MNLISDDSINKNALHISVQSRNSSPHRNLVSPGIKSTHEINTTIKTPHEIGKSNENRQSFLDECYKFSDERLHEENHNSPEKCQSMPCGNSNSSENYETLAEDNYNSADKGQNMPKKEHHTQEKGEISQEE